MPSKEEMIARIKEKKGLSLPPKAAVDNTKPLIVIVTQDHSGLGFAKLCLDADYPCLLVHNIEKEDEQPNEHAIVGDGMVDKMAIGDFMRDKNKYRRAYIFFDGNHSYEEAEELVAKGFKVMGGREFTYKLEKDRKFGTDIAIKAGVNPPPTFEFSNKAEGLKFLDENKDTAYVFKPDDGAGAYTTYVPDAAPKEKANRELYDYLKSQNEDTGTYILQERKDGLEVNIEYWVYKGKPFLAHANFECKKKENHDEGEMVGCAQDVEFIVPIDCKLAQNTIAKLLALPEFKDYTGPLDMNIIIADKQYYFLEYCCRAGYHATPNLVMNLAMFSFPELLIRWIEGDVENFEQYFKEGFGVSVGLRIGHPKTGLPIDVRDDVKFYPYDLYKKEDKYYLAGYGNEVGIVLTHGYTIKQAGEQALKDIDKITYPMHACRTDLDLDNYESSPRLRFEAAQAMKLFD